MLNRTRGNMKRKLFCKGLERNSFEYLWKNVAWIKNMVTNKTLVSHPRRSDVRLPSWIPQIRLPRWPLWLWRGHDSGLVLVGLKKSNKTKTKQKPRNTHQENILWILQHREWTNTGFNHLSVVNIDCLNKGENVLLYLEPTQLRIKGIL